MTLKLTRAQKVRLFAIDTVSQTLGLGHIWAKVNNDHELAATLDRVDTLLHHEAINFLKLPYSMKRRRRHP